MVLRNYKLTTFGETKQLLSLNDVLCGQLLFKDKLYVFDGDGKRVGRFSVTVDTTKFKKCKTLVVHISNRAFFNGQMSETVITGLLTTNLKTIEEFRYEASNVEGKKHERKFYLLRERTKYYYSVTESVCDIENKHQKTIRFAKTTGLIGEAANIVLMRAIAVRGYQGILCLKTILSTGKKCRNYYISKSGQRLVNGIRMDVMIIYRTVTDHNKNNVTSISTFTKAGQLIDSFLSNTPYFLHIDPDLEIYGRMVDENKEVGLHRHWNRDKQVFSYYLDKKFEMEANIRSYTQRNQEMKRVMADWLQYVLQTKPPDILCSSVEYFTAFGYKTFRKCNPKGVPDQDERLGNQDQIWAP